ncbi:hypothetical protein F442_07028 [Phytophthora nicotianae P10297]|uniref:Uncharacterized protein n=1 Tax=Phytophthora nicotianae P10297 TaxID=1317064 RepID=W2ZHN3_PHYNI|nr:hypothetical protein F442_07028 [Phytophthora nicotianae P10297]
MIPFVAQGTDQQLVPADAVCDFESALNDAVHRQFRAIKNLTAQYFSVLLIFRVDGHTAYHANVHSYRRPLT